MQLDLNVNRSRISVLGFTLALIVFAASMLLAAGQLSPQEAIWRHLPAFISLLIAFVLCMVSLWVIVLAQDMSDKAGANMLLSSVGEALMYLALSQAFAGVVNKWAEAVELTVQELPKLSKVPQNLPAVESSGEILVTCLFWFGGLGWALLIYVGPVVSLLRNPLPKHQRWSIFGGYVLALSVVNWILAVGHHVRHHDGDRFSDCSVWVMYLRQFWQPHLWGVV